jgi:acetoin utilization deacetylase AcuC-like enzyme
VKIVYCDEFETNYTTNPVESPDRVKLTAEALRDAGYDFLEAEPASIEDLLRVHGKEHIERVRSRDVFEVARLAAGDAIRAAELAIVGEPAFALVRPPGHHASANRSWGMCYFNNMAVSVARILEKIEKVLILDIDLHFGDGTVNIFRWEDEVTVVNPASMDINFEYLSIDGSGYLEEVRKALDKSQYDIICVSAGFDTYIDDWGEMLAIDDFYRIGQAIKEASIKRCGGRRFAVLEGGYHSDLRYCIKSFIEGF